VLSIAGLEFVFNPLLFTLFLFLSASRGTTLGFLQSRPFVKNKFGALPHLLRENPAQVNVFSKRVWRHEPKGWRTGPGMSPKGPKFELAAEAEKGGVGDTRNQKKVVPWKWGRVRLRTATSLRTYRRSHKCKTLCFESRRRVIGCPDFLVTCTRCTRVRGQHLGKRNKSGLKRGFSMAQKPPVTIRPPPFSGKTTWWRNHETGDGARQDADRGANLAHLKKAAAAASNGCVRQDKMTLERPRWSRSRPAAWRGTYQGRYAGLNPSGRPTLAMRFHLRGQPSARSRRIGWRGWEREIASQKRADTTGADANKEVAHYREEGNTPPPAKNSKDLLSLKNGGVKKREIIRSSQSVTSRRKQASSRNVWPRRCVDQLADRGSSAQKLKKSNDASKCASCVRGAELYDTSQAWSELARKD